MSVCRTVPDKAIIYLMEKREKILVRKISPLGEDEISWEGEVIERRAAYVKLEAFFQDKDFVDLGFISFERNDRFIEWYFSDRWYTIYEVRAKKGDKLKGWYCNITRPTEIRENEIRTYDLALDLWVGPDGKSRVLDEDEFDKIKLSTSERKSARAALKELQQAVETRRPPFHMI